MVKKSDLKKRKIKNRAISAQYVDPLLEYNWKAIEKYFSRGTDHNKEQIRSIHFKKDVKLGPLFSKFTLAALDSSRIESVLDECVADSNQRKWFVDSLFKLQENYFFYFGQNSFFQKREGSILDKLEYPNTVDLEKKAILIRRAQENGSQQKTLGDHLAVHYGQRYWSAFSIPEHLQLHRMLDLTEIRLQCIPQQSRKEGINIVHHNAILSSVVAAKCPDKFDRKIGEFAGRVVDIYSSSKNPSAVTEYFEVDILGGYEAYVENGVVGGDVTVCIQYNSAEQLTAMLKQMNPETRFPYCQMRDANAIHHLTSYDGSLRQTTAIINGMWEYGMVYDSYEILKNNVLAVKNTVHLSMTGSTHGFELLTFDATDVAKKYLSSEPLKGDEDVYDARSFPAIVVIENLVGRLFVTRPGRIPIPLDVNQKLKKLAAASESKVDLCCRMLAPENMRILDKEIVKAVSKRGETGVRKVKIT